MKGFLIFLSILAVTVSEGFACEDTDGRTAIRQYFEESFSPKCNLYVEKHKDDRRWLEGCQQMNFEPHRSIYQGYANRTKIVDISLRKKNGETYGVINYRSPDIVQFQFKLGLAGFCLADEDEIWPFNASSDVSPAAKSVSCGEAFWEDIKITEKKGGFAMACVEGKWKVSAEPLRPTTALDDEN